MLVLPNASWIKLEARAAQIAAAASSMKPGDYLELKLEG